MRNALGPALLFLLATVLALYPQSLHPADTISQVGDPVECVYVLAWNTHALLTQPLHIFDANFLYPHKHALLFDTPRLLESVMAAPLIWTTGNPLLAHNLLLLFVYVFAAMGGWSLARRLGLDPVGSWAAGALYSLHSYQIVQRNNINTLFHGFIPLALGGLIVYLRAGERRHAWILGGLVLLQGLADNYTIVYLTLLLGIVAVAALVARPRVISRRLVGLVPPALAAGVLFSPVILAYVGAARTYRYARGLPEGVDLARFWTTLQTNFLYGGIGAADLAEDFKHAHFLGFLALGLSLMALFVWVRGPRRESAAILPTHVWVPSAAVLASFFLACSLGPEIVVSGHRIGPGPYRFLHDFVPSFQYLRFPERLSMIAMLFVGLLAGRGITILREWGLVTPAVVLAALLPAEHFARLSTVPIPVGEKVPAVYRWLAKNPCRALAEVPTHDKVRKETLEEYFSAFHFRPIIHGIATFEPPLTGLLRQAAANFPSEATLQVFQRVGVDTVIVHWGRPGAGRLAPHLARAEGARRVVLRARFEGAEAHAYDGGVDEVWGILPQPPAEAAPLPSGQRTFGPEWRYIANAGEPEAAADSNLDTAWQVAGPLVCDEFYQVGFGGQAVKVSGIVIPEMSGTTAKTVLPTQFVVRGRRPTGGWVDLGHLDEAHLLQRVDRLLANPAQGAVGFDLGDKELTAVRLSVRPGCQGFYGWVLPEVEVWTR